MDEKKYNLTFAALLHDVGKMVIRANSDNITHSVAGVNFLKKYISEKQEILRAVGHHHGAALKQLQTECDDISYIVYEADNLAASADRRKNEEDNSNLFNHEAPLENIFNVFATEGEQTAFRLRGLNQGEKLHYPEAKSKIKAVAADYAKLLTELESNFARGALETMPLNDLLQILEAVSSFVPSSTATNEVADISLYDHQRLTAAIAACMYDYFQEKGITDYREYCFGSKVEEFRKEKIFILASGDLSGIQNFIYTVPSAGALKSLRGRSFYLELLIENIIDELLEKLALSRANLLYAGGGNFYVLLPNTSKVKMALEELQLKVNKWFLQKWGSSLYLSLGWAECSGNDFKAGEENSLGMVYRAVREQISRDKHSRYSMDDLSELFSPTSEINKTRDNTRECSICHNSAVELISYGDGGIEACPNCKALRDLGERLLRGDVLAVYSNSSPNRTEVALPSLTGEMFLSVSKLDNAEEECLEAERIYIKNKMYTGRLLATRLWMGDYVTQNEQGQTLEFKDLADLSGGGKENSGISRLGILRADVDNLGAAFMAGFPKGYTTLGRNTALSRQLSIFFKCYINTLCRGEMPDDQKKFFLFDEKANQKRNIHIIYSGGDDMFLVGAWDDLLELSVDIRRAFQRFSNDKLNFSAGFALFPVLCPITEMARRTGEMESYAKDKDGKNSISLFGWDTEQHLDVALSMPRFTWNEFINGVCGEKLEFLKKYLDFEGAKSTDKVSVGKGLIYRLLELIRNSSEQINLARFAYTLARMAPEENALSYANYQLVRRKLYEWYQNRTEREQLATAMTLVVYKLRQKGDNK